MLQKNLSHIKQSQINLKLHQKHDQRQNYVLKGVKNLNSKRNIRSGSTLLNNLHSSDLRIHWLLFTFILELAVIPFLLEELDVVVFTVELSFMCNIVRWAYGATSMGAFEAAPVVWSPIHRDLQKHYHFFFKD